MRSFLLALALVAAPACSRPEPVLPRPRDTGVSLDAGVDAASFCEMACEDDTPFCDETSRSCVQCRSAEDCTSSAPRLRCEEHACVQCVNDDDCEPGAPHCSEGACVTCLEDSECDDPAQGHCGETHQCEPCTADPQCAHLSATPVCDEDSGSCVACTPDTEEAQCSGNSCDPATFRCTSTALGSLGSCEACISDSECSASESGTRRCVEIEYLETAATYCLIDKSTAPADTCPRRFVEARASRSVGGVEAEYCGILSNVTCEAIVDFRSTCVTDADCGSASFASDGLCRDDGAGRKCTFRCAGDSDCPEVFVCNTGESPAYCRTAS